jgi:hypothetical protein
MAKTIQDQLAEAIKGKFPDAEVKKVNKDNFLDIHLPGIHPKRGTHLFFNTSGGAIKLGFYCREEDFTQQVLAKNKDLEAYSQGVRPKGNPEWNSVDAAGTAALAFVESLSGKGKKEQPSSSKEVPKPKKETPRATPSKAEDLSDFDLTEFDLEGRAVGRKNPSAQSEEDELRLAEIIKQLESQMEDDAEAVEESIPAAKVPKGKPADTSLADETDRCLEDPRPFLTCIQLIRNYFLVLSSESKAFRASYEETLREFTKAAVVPRISNDMLRLAHEDGNLIESLLLGPMLEAEERYDKNFATHNEYIRSLAEVVSDLLAHCNVGLFLDTLELFMYLGDMLEEEDSPSGSLAAQDRYFILFLMLKASPEQHLDNLEMVLSKGAKSRNANNGCDVKSLVLKASGNFNQLSNEEKLALVLYDFILWDENPGLDIKLEDIATAKSIFTLVTRNATLGEQLVGGFDDNASFEIFQFFNVEFSREGFHEFCLARWKELSSEWNPLKLQLLLEHIKRDFHPNTYINNPVLKDYLKIFEGVRVLDLSAGTTSELAGMMGIEEKGTQEAAAPKKRQKAVPKKAPKKKGGPYSIDEVNKTVEMSVFHQILFIILFVDGKTEGHTDEEIADVTSTAVTIGVWFDKDEDECWEVLEETFELLQKCEELFTEDELDDIADECCFSIHENVTNSDARNDIIRFITDQANADGEVSSSEELNSQIWAMKILLGRV